MKAPSPSDLIGMRLSIARHAASMLNLQFGDIVRDGKQSWGEIALHIQAPWRIRRGNTILVGMSDRWNPIDDVEDWDEWNRSPHPSREDYFWMSFLGIRDDLTRSYECDAEPRTVVRVLEADTSDLSIELDDGAVLETFACGTDDEFWRLFRPRDESPHHVAYLENPKPNNKAMMVCATNDNLSLRSTALTPRRHTTERWPDKYES